MVRFPKTALALATALVLSGCGYTTKSMLSSDVRTVHVKPVENAIDLSTEISDKEAFRTYRPGVEVELTNAIINRFIFDGNLKISPAESADAVLQARLVDYRRDPLRYSESDDIREYRLSVVLDVSLVEKRGGKTLWHETALTGDTTFFLSGSRASSEDEAAARAVEDAARRVVERTFEVW